VYLAVLEAEIKEIAPLHLIPVEGMQTGFQADFEHSIVHPGIATPWRVVLIGHEPGDLLLAPLLYCLNPPCQIASADWVQPGLAMWDWRAWGARTRDGFIYELDMPSWRRLVDFAARTGVRYVVLDANWYGPEFDPQSDPRTSRDDLVIQRDNRVIRKPAPANWDEPIDVPALVSYARQRKVGIILYINDVARLNYPFEETLALYQKWGVAGIKYGFMKGTGQRKVRDTREIVRLCAKHKLLCDFHDDPIPPSGDERTYPNIVAREFCHAQSDAMRSFGPSDFCKMVFVNMVAGPLDMNNGLFTLTNAAQDRHRIFTDVHSTVVSEAARVLVTYSGIAILPDIPEAYDDKSDLFDFVRRLPMTWDDTRIVCGEIGEHITTARRHGENWFVGSVTNEERRSIHLPLKFLQAGKKYLATFFEDAPDADYLTNREAYCVHTAIVSSADIVVATMAPGGGHCILIEPAP
jgi:alpha-glucosidase